MERAAAVDALEERWDWQFPPHVTGEWQHAEKLAKVKHSSFIPKKVKAVREPSLCRADFHVEPLFCGSVEGLVFKTDAQGHGVLP